jgi:hypothetical protein
MDTHASFAPRNVTARPGSWKQLPSRREKLGMGRIAPMGNNGLGATSQDRQRFIGTVAAALQAPAYVLPNIETVRWHFDGPLLDADVAATFGASIDPLGSGRNNPPAGCNSVESTMAEPGKFQTWTLIMAVGIHLEPEPLSFTAKGNSWGPAPTTSTKQPVSPDDFALIDSTIATTTLGLAAGQTLVPADLEWAWWIEKAFWHMSRAYNLVWQWGQSTLLINDSLRYTAYTPSNGQDGASSSSEIDVNAYIRQTNNYYVQTLGANQILLPIDRTRLGNMTLGGNAGSSVYRPTRAYETVGATFGGMGLRGAFRGNAEWRKLSTPFLMKPGVPIGLRMDVTNSDDQAFMQQWIAASQLLNGSVPADFTSFNNVATGAGVTGGTLVGMEPSLDTPVAAQGITTIIDRVIYKGGTWKMTVGLKGFELTDDQAQLVATDSTFRSQLMEGAGCCCPGA